MIDNSMMTEKIESNGMNSIETGANDTNIVSNVNINEISRGKYQSLTMVNWNGFFARTFDIDTLVTTLSGGNGAGKSTTMAAFITALIPDQSLLHFRNTTEAGSSAASRDKGLFGKLQAGSCYATLDIVNSRNQRLLFGVRLQQVAGRDKKVDIKPFMIQGLASDVKPTDVLIETLDNDQARVRTFDDLKAHIATLETVQLKPFSSVADYHSVMFEMGVLPKKLRNTGDRSKFYRLIEASLYGGISSAITRSLRDYLLPQNGGVKKAFQDMESALRENRMTLEAIKATQADRDLFKHLISESTNYVAADYMRHTNDRRNKLTQALTLRGNLSQAQNTYNQHATALKQATEELAELHENESSLEQDYQAASDHLQLVQTALRQQEKIARYKDDLEELNEKLEEQVMIVEEAAEQVEIAQEQADVSEQEVDSLKSQLADFQQALDVQQTQALQYQQALESLTKAQQLINQQELKGTSLIDASDLNEKTAHQYLTELKTIEANSTQALLSLKHKLDISSASAKQYQQALSLIESVVGKVEAEHAFDQAKLAISTLQQAENGLQNQAQWQAQYRETERQLSQQAQAKQLIEQYRSDFHITLNDQEQVEEEQYTQQEKIEALTLEQEQQRDRNSDLRQQQQIIEQNIQTQRQLAPAWLAASDALEALQAQVVTIDDNGTPNGFQNLDDSQSVMANMQRVLEDEKQHSLTKDKLATRRDALEIEIEHLASSSGTGSPELKNIADALGGVLLSEIYDDITIEDAPYFSAMYGPARHAIVVRDLDQIKDSLVDLEGCPDDLYIIEGDADAFDDSNFNVAELDGAVCVELNQQQLRYSRLPNIPLFGRAAREQRLELLRDERDQVAEEYAHAAFESQKGKRLYQSYNQFVSQHIQVAFAENPEDKLTALNGQLNQVTRELSDLINEKEQQNAQISASKQALSDLAKLGNSIHLVEDDMLAERFEELKAKLDQASEHAHYVQTHGRAIKQLSDVVNTLEASPEQFEQLEKEYKHADANLQQVKTLQFAVADLHERRHYFAYADSVNLLSKSSDLSEQLKIKLTQAEQNKVATREALKQMHTQHNQYNQLLASIKSSYQTKLETVQEFTQELQEYGINTDHGVQERAESRKNELYETLSHSRQRKSACEKTVTATELEIKSLAKRHNKVTKEYGDLRKFIVTAKAAWCSVLQLARVNDVERRLHRRELAYLSENELRSMSDKALGALRLAVANNETLRDALRLSEDNGRPEGKVLFYISIYQHLRERIRQDIIRTNDPVEAIEEMEVELARLTEELTLRENRLAISSGSVASIIKKTIQREQNRIRMLNQGLSQISFGQVRGVRLNVGIRESHQTLLDGLADPNNKNQDLFNNAKLTFSEAMAKLFQRVNPHIDMGQRSPQILGEELLDYRNYLELSIEVNRGTEGWLKAESGALSTGEAIGTGQSILLMVLQSWEEESRRLRSKDILPCRLLFLDEAARLDTNSINTLFELCDRLDMQLLIAAPENISPEQGTTYKLVRKVLNDREHVHVVGLKGFGKKEKAELNTLEMIDSLAEA